ncbi:MAG: penicillin-binding protein [Oxalobacter sp.]|nr:MAG: penicillin-binding protein [Oxalobacter sp.]
MFYAMRSSLVSGIILFVLLCAYALALIPSTPDIADLRKAQVEQASRVVSADSKIIATFSRWNSEWVPIERVSPHAVKALIATEDHRFYDHGGVDVFRTAASAVWTLLGRQQGGSTITQQLARNRYPQEIGRSRSINRKIKEIITALKIERAYSKKEILETYLNTVPFFYNARGIEMASRIYFDKSSADLNILESATLIGMLKGSSYYNPVLNPERALQRRNVVMAQMVKRNVLEQENYDRLKQQKLELNFDHTLDVHGIAPHFVQHVRKWLVDWADLHDRNIYADGLVVHTTLDSRIQVAANQAVRRQMEKLQVIADVEWGVGNSRLISKNASAYLSMRQRVQAFSHFWNTKKDLVDAFIRESEAYRRAMEGGAEADKALAQLRKDERFMARLREEKTRLQTGLLAMDPTTGHVKAWVGSRDYGADQFDHVVAAQRQPGSTFKPFVYGAALEQGMASDRKFTERVVEFKLPNGSFWRPSDLSPQLGREMTMREGLVYSRNSITAQIMQEIGPAKTAAFAQRMGVNQSKLDSVPSIALGTSPVTLMEMVSAYGTFANRGEYRKPIYITHVTDKNGATLLRFDNPGTRALPENVADELLDMMRGVVSEGTGKRITTEFGLPADLAGKTGTTQKNTDGWFILMHPKLVAGAWVGFNDARVTMRSGYWGQGAHNALSVVGDFFKEALYPASAKGERAPEFETGKGNVVNSFFKKISNWFSSGKQDAEAKDGDEKKGDAKNAVSHPTDTPDTKKPKQLRNITLPSGASSAASAASTAVTSSPAASVGAAVSR